MTAPSVATSDIAVRRARRWRFVVVAVAVATVDLVSKAIASRALAERDVDLPGPLDLSLAYNSGVAFSIGVGVPPWVLVVLATSIATVVATAAWKGQLPSAVAAGLVVGGAAANVVDRVQAGSVVDMLHTGWWPTFNLADVWIVVGCALLILTEFNVARRRDESTADTPTQGDADS
jgi:signal peptidase II